MTTESELIRKRQEVRDEILALKEKIPSARILNGLGKTFKRNSLGYWILNFALLNLIILSPWALIGLALGEIKRTIPFFVPSILAIELVTLGFVVAHIAVQFIFDDIASRIVEQISNIDDLSKILLWLQQSWSTKNVSAFVFPFCLVWVSLNVLALSLPTHQFVGLGLSLTTFLFGLFAGTVGYVYMWLCLLVSSLKKYQYNLNSFSPADSEIISDISDLLTKGIYFLALIAAVLTLFFASNLLEVYRVIFSFPVLVGSWMLIAMQFLLTRSTLSAITNREKWKTLNRIQMKINALESSGDLSDKDTAERLLRLVDIHKQIKASKTNIFDLKSFSTLFSQLMLPLLGLLLGNLDKLSKLLP